MERTSPDSYYHGPDHTSAQPVLVSLQLCFAAFLSIACNPHYTGEKKALLQSGRGMRTGGGEREERKTRQNLLEPGYAPA